jgi:hypothetical protein
MTLADADALHDPLVVGGNHLFQVLIREDAGRRIAPQRRDFGPWQCFCPFKEFRVTHLGYTAHKSGCGWVRDAGMAKPRMNLNVGVRTASLFQDDLYQGTA